MIGRAQTDRMSPFGAFLAALCERKRTSLYAAGVSLGYTSRSFMTYATRPHAGKSRRNLLTVKEIRRLARWLDCSSEEEFKLTLLGALDYAPPLVSEYVQALENEVERYRMKTGGRRLNFKLDGPR